MSEIKEGIKDAMKQAMRAKEKQRLSTIRLILSEFKKIEVDERIELDDTRVLSILDKMSKQRRDAITQYQSASREDLANKERFELDLIQTFLPAPLTAEEIDTLISESIQASGATSMQDMGKVMAAIKPLVQGKADMGKVSQSIKAKLGN